MCPDQKLWSAFADGEVPSPWKERMESHAASCPDCARRLEAYRRVDTRMASLMGPSETGELDAAGRRIASRLASLEASAKPSSSVRLGVRRRPTRFPLPMALAAAAAAAFVFFAGVAAGFLGLGRGGLAMAALRNSQPAASAVGSAFQTGGTVMPPSGATFSASANSMEALVSYLDSQGASQAVVIRLPSEASFQTIGNPVITTSMQGQGK